MFDILDQVMLLLSSSIYSRADAAIAALCGSVWTWIFGPLVGLLLGYHILVITMDDQKSLADGGKDLIKVLIPLLIAAYIIRPDAGTCKAVTIKDQALETRSMVTAMIAPTFGDKPEDLLLNTVKAVGGVMGKMANKVAETLYISNNQSPWVAGVVSAVANYFILAILSLITLIIAAIMTAVIVAHILIQDFALVFAAIFFPLGVALWPVSKTWAMSTLSVMLQAVCSTAALAFFVEVLFAPGGALDSAITSAISKIDENDAFGQVMLMLSSSLAIIVFLVSVIAVAYAIPRMLKQIFVKIEFEVLGKP
jgi:hypothetical protein